MNHPGAEDRRLGKRLESVTEGNEEDREKSIPDVAVEGTYLIPEGPENG